MWDNKKLKRALGALRVGRGMEYKKAGETVGKDGSELCILWCSKLNALSPERRVDIHQAHVCVAPVLVVGEHRNLQKERPERPTTRMTTDKNMGGRRENGFKKNKKRRYRDEEQAKIEIHIHEKEKGDGWRNRGQIELCKWKRKLLLQCRKDDDLWSGWHNGMESQPSGSAISITSISCRSWKFVPARIDSLFGV